MSKESYARGFCKAAAAAGVDPVALAKFAEDYFHYDRNLKSMIDDSLETAGTPGYPVTAALSEGIPSSDPARSKALEERAKAIVSNARGGGDVPYKDLSTWYGRGVPALSRAIAEGWAPNEKYDYTSGTNALTQAVLKYNSHKRMPKRNIIEGLRNLKYDYPADLYSLWKSLIAK